ncbi:MAG: hypothetical protein IJZ85_12825 [Lachnospiraceae bacterium]|nr:hypothetical protein [Lachnospiraceae bacterium]
MKERLSVMMLAARGTVYKVILLIAVTGIVQAGLFYWWMMRSISPDDIWLVNLESGMTDSHVVFAAAISFVILCAILSLNGCSFGSKAIYTFRRLSVSQKEVLCCWAVYNTLAVLLFWMSQILIMLGLCGMYKAVAPILCEQSGVPASNLPFGPQTVYIAFYRHKYLHSLMPMAEISRWIRNVILLGSLGICTATFSNSVRKGKKGIAIFVLVTVTLGMFCASVGMFEVDIVSGLIALGAGVGSGAIALGGVEDEAYI